LPGLFPPRERAERRHSDTLAEQRGKAHGRVEYRRLRATARLSGYLDWPGVQQVCVLERTRVVRGQTTVDTVFAITSLGPDEAGAAELLALARQQWESENRLHWVRDATLGEDACRVRTGAVVGTGIGGLNSLNSLSSQFRSLAQRPPRGPVPLGFDPRKRLPGYL